MLQLLGFHAIVILREAQNRGSKSTMAEKANCMHAVIDVFQEVSPSFCAVKVPAPTP